MKHSLVYVKTHKTAGSTLLNIILRLGLSLNLTCIPPRNGHSGYGCPHRLPIHFSIPNGNIFAQHVTFEPRITRLVHPRPPLIVSIVRDPAAQAVSSFMYQLWGHIKKKFGSTNWTDHVQRMGSIKSEDSVYACYYINPQANDLGYFQSMDVQKTVDAYDLIMITEQFDKGLVVLMHFLQTRGWRVTTDHFRYTRASANRGPMIDGDKLHSMMRDVSDSRGISIDRQIYKVVSDRFNAEWSMHETLYNTELESLHVKTSSTCTYCNMDYVRLMSRCAVKL